MINKTLLQLRKEISKRRPRFIQQEAHKRKAVDGSRWKRPKGMDSKMRAQKHGKAALVNPGFRGPAEVRGLHASGLQIILAHTIEEINKIDPKIQGAIIAHVGGRKRIQLIKQCQDKKVTILNYKDANNEIKKVTDAMTQRKTAKKQKMTQATVEKTETPKKETPKEQPKTKEEQNKEMEKIITQRE